MNNLLKYLAEFFGTLFLVYIIFFTGNWIAIGAGLAIPVLLLGKISGGAFNPAVAISLYADNKLTSNETIIYIIVEILGGLAGFCLYKKIAK